MPKDTSSNTDDRGLINGYRPNRISLYILLLISGRLDELGETLEKDMQKYRISEDEHKNN